MLYLALTASLLCPPAGSQVLDWAPLYRAAQQTPSAPGAPVAQAPAPAPEPTDAEFAALITEAFAKWQHTDLGVIDGDGKFRRFWPKFKSDVLGEFPPRIDGFSMVMEGRDHRQLSHIRQSQAGVSGFVVHAWFVLPEALRKSDAFKGTQAADKGVFYAVFPMNDAEKQRFASDVRTAIYGDPKNAALASYYRFFIDPFVP